MHHHCPTAQCAIADRIQLVASPESWWDAVAGTGLPTLFSMASRPLNTPSGSTKSASSVKSAAKAVALLTSENRALRGNCLVFGQPTSADGRYFNMKTTMFALVLAIGMAFSAFAADEPSKIKLEGVIEQSPAVRLLGICDGL